MKRIIARGSASIDSLLFVLRPWALACPLNLLLHGDCCVLKMGSS